MKITKYLACKDCSWVHFAVTRQFAIDEVNTFIKYYDKLSDKQKEEYYSNEPARIEDYEKCFRCGSSYKNSRKALKKELPFGSTIQPLIDPKE